MPRQSHMISRAAGITRSVVTYYGPVWRRRRFKTFYEQFLGAGDLAFDIGAHVGNRVHVFRRIGARVVAIEPPPAHPDSTAHLVVRAVGVKDDGRTGQRNSRGT